jgi:hypothetical protein
VASHIATDQDEDMDTNDKDKDEDSDFDMRSRGDLLFVICSMTCVNSES